MDLYKEDRKGKLRTQGRRIVKKMIEMYPFRITATK